MSNDFKMKVDVANYSYIIHTICAVILFLVNIFILQHYSLYVLCISEYGSMSDCYQ